MWGFGPSAPSNTEVIHRHRWRRGSPYIVEYEEEEVVLVVVLVEVRGVGSVNSVGHLYRFLRSRHRHTIYSLSRHYWRKEYCRWFADCYHQVLLAR